MIGAWKTIPGGYAVELAVPWRNLGVTPTDGLKLGYDLIGIDDDNGGGRDNQLIWSGEANAYNNTSAFGELQLLPGAATEVKLTSVCSEKPNQTRRWRVTSTYREPVSFTWDVYGTAQRGTGTVPAGGTVYFETNTVPNSPNTVRIHYLGQMQTKASGGEKCPAPTARVAVEGGTNGETGLQVYPNPARDRFTLRYYVPAAQTVQVAVTGARGRHPGG